MKAKQIKKLLEKNDFFDKIFYLRNYRDARLADSTPIDHFCAKGISEDYKPNAEFDPVWYRNYYQDVKENGGHPVLHYLLYGKKEGRFKNAIDYESRDQSTVSECLKSYNKKENNYALKLFSEFDEKFYLNYYPDIKRAGVNPREHFDTVGWKEGRKPNSWFDTRFYLNRYPDVKDNEINPFSHYQKYGVKEGRDCNHLAKISQVDQLLSSGVFDPEFYLNAYQYVRDKGLDPLQHYLSTGFKENRNPSLTFDNFFYMKKNELSECPLNHFLDNEDLPTLPENAFLISSKENECFESNLSVKIAIQAHIFYPDVVDQIIKYLGNIPIKYDLLISVITEADGIYAKEVLSKAVRLNKIYVKVVENSGRDVSPLLVAFKDAWREYDYICHIHTKRSLHTDFGDEWRTYLFDKILGSEKTVKAVLNKLESDNDLAFIYPENFHKIKKYTSSDSNVSEINSLLNRLGLAEEESYSDYPFAAGTMGWFKTKCYKDLVNLEFQYDDFKNTNEKLDATLAHAMERFFAIYPVKKGFKTAVFYSQPNNQNIIDEAKQFSQSFPVGNKWMRDDPKISANPVASLSPMHNFFNKDSLVIHWVIPDFGIGAGGHMTIFRMIYFLEKLGHRQTIWIQNVNNYRSPFLAKETISKYYQPIGKNVDVQFLPDNTEWISGDIAIATDCWTAYPVRSMSKFKKRCYFIQDYEPIFHPMGENYLIAEQTYDFGFTAITAGPWLKKKAQDKGMTAYDFPLCADETVYSVTEEKSYTVKDKLNIAFYSRSYTPRRAVRLGIAGLNELAKHNDNIHVHCFGQDDLPVEPEFDYTNHGILTPQELASLYNSCDIGVVFSATNYSLIPLEMMACGLPIVELDVESTRYVFGEDVVTFAQPNVPAIAKGVQSLIDNPGKREAQIQAGLAFLQNISWEKAAQNVNDALYTELDKENYTPLDINSITNSGFSAETHATVVIPTLNAAGEIDPLLDKLLTQKTSFSFDVLVIDSASDDGTQQILERYASQHDSISYIGIQRSEFQHGKTRDMGIEKAKGDYVAFLTQDALPYDQHWLEQLIKSFGVDEKIVGVFGKHKAYEAHSPFVKRDIYNHFKHFEMLPQVYSWHDAMPSHIERGSLEWQMKMMFYSDNNSAICKQAWHSIHYPHIDWGEDQVWAWTIVQLGLKKYYAKDSIVYHSHDDTYETRLKVSSIERDFFYNNFGVKLISGEEHAEQTKRAQDRNDANYAALKGVSQEELEKQMLLNEASAVGRSGFQI